MRDKRFRVFMYKDELNFLKWLVLQRPSIETGGDLFGLWQSDYSAVVQLVLGPGINCSRTTTSFHQDVQYLAHVGHNLTTFHGLCNIGEWHSHHTIGLAEPSYGDRETVWNHLSEVAGGRFLVFIANIRGSNSNPTVNVGCFMFNYANRKILVGKIKGLPQSSPQRKMLNAEYLKQGAERLMDWETFLQYTNVKEPAKGVSQSTHPETSSISRNAKTSFGGHDSEDTDEYYDNCYEEEDPLLKCRRKKKRKEGICARLLRWMKQFRDFVCKNLCCCFQCSAETTPGDHASEDTEEYDDSCCGRLSRWVKHFRDCVCKVLCCCPCCQCRCQCRQCYCQCSL